MNTLVLEINDISELALQIMQPVVAKNTETQIIQDDDSGPVAVASAMSDFFTIAAAVENGDAYLEPDELSEFGDYGLELLDRASHQIRQLGILDLRDKLSRLYPSLAVWLARRDATLDNLEGTADAFAMLVNGISDTTELVEMCQLMEEVIGKTSEKLQLDEDKGNDFRPWRVINLNTGIAATRSLDPELMESTFEKLGQRLPFDMPGFFADGKRQLAFQTVPDAVSEVMDRYAEKWPVAPTH